jgi:exosome complex RNA-binding protein Rrp42 (RNase PH superfamily)
MASASFAAGKPGEGAVELARLVERCMRGSGALDLEALCVLPGRKVRERGLHCTVLGEGGNAGACWLVLCYMLDSRDA